jgi:hypothetical protein
LSRALRDAAVDRAGFAGALAVAVLLAAVLLLVPQVVLLGKLPDHFDFWLQEYVHLDVLHRWLRSGELPLWNGQLAAGTPHLADPQAAVLYPPTTLPLLVGSPAAVARLSIPLHFFLAAIFTYGYARQLRLSRPAATAAGLAYALAPHFAPLEGATYLQQSAAWVPAILWALHAGLQRACFAPFAIAGALWALQLYRGYPQTWYSTGLLAGAYCALLIGVEALARRRVRRAAKLAVGSGLFAVVALGLGAAQLLPSLDLLGASHRAAGFTLAEASGPGRITLLNLLGVAGPDAEVSGAFPGGAVVGLAIAAALHAKARATWGFATGGILALLLCLGDQTPLWGLMYRFVPGFQTLHMPHRMLFAWSLGLAMLAGLGVDALATRPRWRPLAVALGLTVGCVWLAASAVTSMADGAIRSGLGHLAAGALALALAGVALERRWLRSPVVAAALVALVGVDLLTYSLPRLHGQFYSPAAVYAPPPAVQWLQRRLAAHVRDGDGPYRFASAQYLGDRTELPRAKLQDNRRIAYLPPNVSALYPELDAAQGYLAIRRADAGDLFNAVNDLGRTARVLSIYDPRSRLLDLLNVRYFLTDRTDAVTSVVGGGFSLTAADPPRDVVVREPGPASLIELFSSLGDSVEVSDGAHVGDVALVLASGREAVVPIIAGQHTAEWLYDDPRLAGSVRHRKAPVARSERRSGEGGDYYAHSYRAGIDLAPYGDDPVTTMRFRVVAPTLRWNVERVLLTVRLGERFRLAYADTEVRIWENLAALPRAWWVGTAVVVDDRSAQVEWLKDQEHDLFTEVAVEAAPSGGRSLALAAPATSAEPGEGAGMVTWIGASANTREVRVDAPADGLLIMSESFAPGWRAWLDGTPAQVLRANGFLQAVAVPAGSHQVVLRYLPDSVVTGAALSAAASLALIAWLAHASWTSRRSRVAG